MEIVFFIVVDRPLICVFQTTILSTLLACYEPDYFIFVPYIKSTHIPTIAYNELSKLQLYFK